MHNSLIFTNIDVWLIYIYIYIYIYILLEKICTFTYSKSIFEKVNGMINIHFLLLFCNPKLGRRKQQQKDTKRFVVVFSYE